MPLSALALLLVSAFLHATWNLLIKRAREKQIFTWWALIVGLLCFSPLLLQVRAFPVSIWPYVLSSALMEAIYYFVLIRAYQYGDFSLVYPLARGAAPALLTLWAVLFLGERPAPSGLVGIGLLICGLVVVGSTSWWQQRRTSSLVSSALGLALATACCVSIYSAIDGAAVRQVAPLPYTVMVVGLAGVLITPLIVVRYGGQAMLTEMRASWPLIVLAGILSLLTYMLVLLAYSFSPVSYGGAIREISVVIAAFIGWRWLGEGFGRARLLGAALIFVGILAIALAG
ncbi:MAG TPA: DMT family transporter [Ktedonobacteraceae bacterium]|nr:DMT family transporter [Ktedonobacteraceae bacterium]